MVKQRFEKFRFKNDEWFDFIVECESYDKAKEIYNHYRKRGNKI